MNKFLRTVFNRINFPCPACNSDNVPPGGNDLCQECIDKLHLFPDHEITCPGCGGIMDGALALCSQCLAEPLRPWQQAIAVFPYRHYGKQLIRMMKFANRPELARPLGILAARKLQQKNIYPDIIVPVPQHIIRFISRGYNQAELLAQIISEALDLPMVPALKRKISFSKQSKLNRRARHALKNVCSCPHPEKIVNKHILLVDDVLTTGATLTAAAEALRAAGAGEISVLVIARTQAYTKIK